MGAANAALSHHAGAEGKEFILKLGYRDRLSMLALGLAGLSMSAHGAAPVDLVLRPRPQTYTDSCQSYGLAFAAASVPGTSLPAATGKQLRTLEVELRTARDAIANKDGASPYDHAVWKKALEQVSAGALTLDIQYVSKLEDFVKKVEAATGISNAQSLGATLTAALVKTPVLTSVEKVGNDSYATGHIIEVLGVARGNASPPGLAVLNPAVKVGASPEKKACELDDGVGDTKYQAFASVESAYKLKPFGGKFLFMIVRKK
jgi:hypothetical protein